MKRRLRAYVIALTAFFMAGCAAFFSVTGVGKLASGAGLAAILLVAALEVGKLVIASFVHRRWKQIRWAQRIFAVFGIIVAMALTSIGIFGQLIGGYTTTSAEFQIGSQEIRLKESEKEALNGKISRFEDQIERKEKRADDLASLRTQQEAQKDSLENRRAWKSALAARELIESTNDEIQNLNTDIDSLNNEINLVMSQIASVDSAIVVMNGELATGEAAPLKMIADMLGVEMDTATKAFFGFFVLIFDPFAIMLVIFFNIEIDVVRKEEEEQKKAAQSIDIEKKPELEPKSQAVPPVDWQSSIEPTVELVSSESHAQKRAESDSMVLYSHDDRGEFQPQLEAETKSVDNIDVSILEETAQKYMKLLRVLYINGTVSPGENLYTFKDFSMAIEKEGIEISDKDLEDFLKVCVMLKVINVDKYNRKAIMSYRDAREVISKLKD